ncbi:MAG: hypothetical protein D6725_05000, partial [Planctomycetota bacterium]
MGGCAEAARSAAGQPDHAQVPPGQVPRDQRGSNGPFGRRTGTVDAGERSEAGSEARATMDETARTADGRHWRPSATIEMLRRRAALLATLRAFFHRNGYWEVETPLLCRESVVDAHLDPFELYTEAHERLFLQTSPELCMKRLVSAGAERIFQVTRAFRRGESG